MTRTIPCTMCIFLTALLTATGSTRAATLAAQQSRSPSTHLGSAPTTSTVYLWTLRGPDGEPLRQLTSTFSSGTENRKWLRDLIYGDGRLLATIDYSPTGPRQYHYHLDHVGTPRLITDATGQVVARPAFHTFGEQLQESSYPHPVSYQSHERDASNLDYIGSRYYFPAAGRFGTPDPLNTGWNLYSFVNNAPMTRVDETGSFESLGHGTLTYWLLAAAGVEETLAFRLALATESVDINPATAPTTAPNVLLGFMHTFIAGMPPSPTTRYHFPNVLDPSLASDDFDYQISRSDINPDEWGLAFHALEDVGFPGALGPHARGTPGLGNMGHPFFRSEAGPTSFFFNHVADQGFQNPHENETEAWALYDVLVIWASYHGGGATNRDTATLGINLFVTANTGEKVHAFNNLAPPGFTQSYAARVQATTGRTTFDSSIDFATDPPDDHNTDGY